MKETRAKAIINLENIVSNYKYVAAGPAAGAKVIAVVKADAYGHGAAETAAALAGAGCGFFAVATADEGAALREAGVDCDILVLGVTPAEDIGTVRGHGLIQAVNSFAYAESISGAPTRVHIKVDTGMSRLGIYCHTAGDIASAESEIEAIHRLPGLECEGIFTHFACADDLSAEMTARQFDVFTSLCDETEKHGTDVGMRHCSSSAAILLRPQMHLDAVRAGIVLYGYMPDGSVNESLRPAMQLVSRVVQISHIRKGDSVSYGATFVAEHDMDIATVSVGYADGYFRALSGKASVAVNGRRAKLVGRICMDICMADVTGIPCEVGDAVEIFGKTVSADELAELAGTINYEILCSVRSRVGREYI